MVLGLDTSSRLARASLVEHAQVVLERTVSALEASNSRRDSSMRSIRTNHAETLLPLVERILREAGASLSRLSAIAVTIGPGSFTGLRVGLSTAKGLVYGSATPVFAVSTLEALAQGVTRWQGLVCPMMDARKRQIYTALYRAAHGVVHRITDDRVCGLDSMLDDLQSMPEECVLFVGEGITEYRKAIATVLGERAGFRPDGTYPSTASAAAIIAERRMGRERPEELLSLAPRYLRPPDAVRRDVVDKRQTVR